METELDGAEDMRSEDSLAKRLADGDPSAPGELVKRHHAELSRYAWALLRDASAAEDAVQTAFEKAFVALGKYSEERVEALSLRPWLYRIVLNVVRNVWRGSHREVSVAKTPEPDESLGTESGSIPSAGREAWVDAPGGGGGVRRG